MLKGVKREEVVLTRADDGYFIDAPTSTTFAEAMGFTSEFADRVPTPEGVRVVYRGPVGGIYGHFGLRAEYEPAVASWNGDELVLVCARKNVQRVEIATPAAAPVPSIDD